MNRYIQNYKKYYKISVLLENRKIKYTYTLHAIV